MATNHVIQREHFPEGTSCSATRCAKKPIFLVRYNTSKGPVERRYCGSHGYDFAKKNSLRIPPKGVEDVKHMSLSIFTDDALEALRNRIQEELVLRGNLKQHTFTFDEIGPSSCKPYVARLRTKGPGIARYFFSMHQQNRRPDLSRIHGTYSTFSGAVIEKRLGVVDNGETPWLRFVVTAEGEEILLGAKGNLQLEAKILAYLQQRIPLVEMLVQAQGINDAVAYGLPVDAS